MKKLFTLFLLAGGITGTYAQKLEKLTIENIMRDPKWMGTSPTNIAWSADSKKIYFTWNMESEGRDALYGITTTDLKPQRISLEERKNLANADGSGGRRGGFGGPSADAWNSKHTLKLIEKDGDIFIQEAKTGKLTQLTATVDRESNPTFSADDTHVFFLRGDNAFSVKLNGGELVQLTNFTHNAPGAALPAATAALGGGQGGGRRGSGGLGQGGGRGASRDGAQGGTPQDKWLRNEQTQLFDVLKSRAQEERAAAADRRALAGTPAKHMRELPAEDKTLGGVVVSPDGRFVTYRLTKQPEGVKTTIVPNYVTASGYTEDIINRTKVGAPLATTESFVYDTQRDTVYNISIKEIPGIKDLPDYVKDYPGQLAERKKLNEDRKVTIQSPNWSDDGKTAVVIVSAQDYKDRWIMKLDAETGKLSLLDRQRDEAWIAGPGIAGFGGSSGWLDNSRFFFQSEASGYSHLYVVDVNTGKKTQLTSGKWEVSGLHLSNDKKTFYFSANMDHPGVADYYRIPVTGGAPVKLTSMRGGNEVELSPDEKWLAIRYSYTNKPYELYLQPNKTGRKSGTGNQFDIRRI
jgi:Tol biopolymer transport system component